MSGSNCCFLTYIQVSQEADKVVWYSHLLKNFPQFVVIYTVKGFGIVNKAEVDIFLELSCFFYDPKDVGNLISGSSAFSKSSLNIWKFSVHVLLKPSLEILSITLLACEMGAIMQWFEHYLTLPFFGIGMKTDLFQSCGHCWVFQIWIYQNCEEDLKWLKLEKGWASSSRDRCFSETLLLFWWSSSCQQFDLWFLCLF